MKIKANEKLFKRWQQLGLKIGAMKSVAQNDMNFDEATELKEWLRLAFALQSELDVLIRGSVYHI